VYGKRNKKSYQSINHFHNPNFLKPSILKKIEDIHYFYTPKNTEFCGIGKIPEIHIFSGNFLTAYGKWGSKKTCKI
jgi:hypothetical protein